MRSLGLDIGDKRIGVALSDTLGILATPLTILERYGDDRDIEAVINLINQNEVKQVVVGLPLSMSGSVGHQAEKVRVFVKKLTQRIEVPIVLRDESFTTVEAQRLMHEANTKQTKRKTRDDAIAAAVILQSYLDEKSNARESERL